MRRVRNITAVNISLEVGGETVLFVLLAEDGSINRFGTGSATNTQRDMFIGVTNEPLFKALLESLTDDMLKFAGGYDVPEQEGPECRLAIGLMFRDGEQDGFGFSYGLHSQGPPTEIATFVRKAVAVTNPWFEAQKAMVTKGGNPSPSRPWWKFW